MTGKWTSYPTLRENLAPGFAELSDEQIDALVEQFYGEGLTGEDLEGFFDSIKHGLGSVAGAVGQFAQKAAPVVMNTLPGIAQGAMAGSALGPYGMLAGAIAGGAGSALSQSKNRTLSGIGHGLGTVTQLASSVRGGGAGGIGSIGALLQGGRSQPGGGGGGNVGGIANLLAGVLSPNKQGNAPSPAGATANTLLGMLARPEVGRALMSAAMGGLGRQSIPMGSNQVGVQSILNAISTLAGRAAGEMAGTESESLPGYLYGEDGELAFDPAERNSRTDALLTYMVLTAPAWAAKPPVVVMQPEPSRREPEYTEADAEADEWLWAEVYESEYPEDEAYA